MKTSSYVCVIVLSAVLLASCSTPSVTEPASSETQEIRGFITELEPGFLSVRANDGRQFIFYIQGSSFEFADLKDLMNQHIQIDVSYIVEDSRLVPTEISRVDD